MSDMSGRGDMVLWVQPDDVPEMGCLVQKLGDEVDEVGGMVQGGSFQQ